MDCEGKDILSILTLYPEARKESVFERANRIANENKARKWAEYEPLPRLAFEDDWLHPEMVTISVIGDTGTRSSFGRAQMRSTGATVMRPTEMTATAQAYSSTGQGQEDVVVIRLERADMDKHRKCVRCNILQPIKNFDRDKRFPAGVAFYCRKCKEELHIKRAA